MILCPSCGHKNIEGADSCEQCGQSLDELSIPQPATEVERRLMSETIETLGPRRPLIVSPTMPISEVLRLLVDNDVGLVIVTEDEKVVGVFSERDTLLKLNIDTWDLGGDPVSKYMTTNPETLEASASIAFAVHKMDIGGFRHIPIVDADNRPIGIISVRDILHYLTEAMNAEPAA